MKETCLCVQMTNDCLSGFRLNILFFHLKPRSTLRAGDRVGVSW
nr:MAG TPA: hypothetical protein [Bacteriophage sp.]